MRELNTNDIFKMSRILGKLNLKMDFEIDNEDENWDEKLGVSLLQKIAENLHLVQTEVNDFLGDLCGMSGEEFGKLPIKQTMKHIKEFQKLDGVADFFKLAGRSMK